MSRFLITTADERTWKFDRPVLFLGEWCRLYHRRHVWECMDARVAEPYGLGPGQKERDLAYTHAVFRPLLVEMAEVLNAFHSTSHTLRYWTILLGHWLRRYIETAFNRYFTLEQALKNHEVSGATVFDDQDDYNLATNDTLASIWASNDDVWNHVFYARILNFWQSVATDTQEGSLKRTGFRLEEEAQAVPPPGLKDLVRKAAGCVLPRLAGKHDALIVHSYLPLWEEVKLQLSLGQCPQLWRTPAVEVFQPARDKRRAAEIASARYQGFERFVRTQLIESIPTCYFEGYGRLLEQVNALPWPAEPRFIFTSNNFDTDEVFKVWCGRKVEQGTPYFTGQHGSNYGTHFHAGNANWPERSAADRFFSWGWSDGSPTVVPAFIFKTANRKANEFDADGGLLLVEDCTNQRLTHWDEYFEFGVYQGEQFRFVAALPPTIRAMLTVRLHAQHKKVQWSEEQRWIDRCPHTRIETGSASLRKLVAQSRLVVYSYDSTGVLESLASNIPTLGFWHYGLDNLLSGARPYYELLVDAGILARSPEHAAELVTFRWDNVNDWWGSEKVQKARASFCERYARMEKYPVRTLRRLLIKQSETLRSGEARRLS